MASGNSNRERQMIRCRQARILPALFSCRLRWNRPSPESCNIPRFRGIGGNSRFRPNGRVSEFFCISMPSTGARKFTSTARASAFTLAVRESLNTMRVFLHDLAWREDPEGFYSRVDKYLQIADKHGIKTLFVIFDAVWHPNPHPGKQPGPVPGLHNSGWVQSPGRAYLESPAKQDELKPYVIGLLTRYKNDSRVLAWDLFNEPDNPNRQAYGRDGARIELTENYKEKFATQLLEKTFA